MSRKVKLAIGIHNHQPVGNFDFVFEEAYHKAYLPFLNILEKHPKIKIAQHFTGVLFEWLLQRDPQFGPRLRALVQSGQVEMMSGGYYEPILVNIPDEDKLGQIQKLNDFIKEHTGYEPKGIWLAERIWEPQLPKPISQSGAKYVVIDDSHFKSAGLEEKDLFGYYVTEETGHVINLFPISEQLRYTIPFQNPEVTIDYLRSIATENGDKLAVFADDGEKFGIWPGTYKHCYEDRWMERFFSLLEANLDWIELVHFSEVIETMAPAGRVYLPTASYREMMEWAMPARAIERYESFEQRLKQHTMYDEYKVFVRGGFWRNFLAKYPESNNLHKKSLWVSNKIQKLMGDKKYDQTLLSQAQDNLWAGQTNCPYWHGVFGGLYLNNLRYAVYNRMIKAEAILDQLTRTNSTYEKGWVDVQSADLDADGNDELIIESKFYNLYFSPQIGGTLFEQDYKPKAVNLLDTMTRRKEAYHAKLLQINENKNDHSGVASIHDLVVAKEPGLAQRLKYDWYRRSSFIDHFFAQQTTLEEVANCEYRELGDFVTSPFGYETAQNPNGLKIRLAREGVVIVENARRNISLVKAIQVNRASAELGIRYEITNLDQAPLHLWFGIEFNFALLAGNAPDRYYYFDQKFDGEKILASKGSVDNVSAMGLIDEWMKLDIQLAYNRPATVWRFPIETISQSEGGFERVYQSSVVLPNWQISLKEKETWSIEITQKVIDL
ncbi:MAG: alpha-amylase/4-alpha-glucanotransferase domain-containing protein [Candidatus Zhuqueibacterota bacterium]